MRLSSTEILYSLCRPVLYVHEDTYIVYPLVSKIAPLPFFFSQQYGDKRHKLQKYLKTAVSEVQHGGRINPELELWSVQSDHVGFAQNLRIPLTSQKLAHRWTDQFKCE